MKMLQWLFERFVESHLWLVLARKYVAHLTFRVWRYPRFPMERYFEIREIVRSAPPDTMFGFVGADTKCLAWKLNHLFGSRWGHAGFVRLGENQEVDIYDMKGDGIRHDTLLEYLREIDNFALLEIPFDSAVKRSQAWQRFWRIVRNPEACYDYQLRIDPVLLQQIDQPDCALPTKLYCSEFPFVVAHSLTSSARFEAHAIMERPKFDPDDFFHACTVRLLEQTRG